METQVKRLIKAIQNWKYHIHFSSSGTVQSSEEVSQLDSGTGEEEEADEEEEESLLMFDESSVGTSVTISNNGTTAARDRDSFCNGVVFSKVFIAN